MQKNKLSKMRGTTEMIPINGYGYIAPFYLRWFLKSPFFIEYANSSTHGMRMPRLGTGKAINSFIALPPLAEQKRIVSKVDSLMALCDRLGENLSNKGKMSGKMFNAVVSGM